MLCGQFAPECSHAGLPDDTVHIRLQRHRRRLQGLLSRGLTLELVGEGGDYVSREACPVAASSFAGR